MRRKYDEIMDKIELSEESKKRILANIQELNLAEKEKPKTRMEKIVQFSHRRGLYAAACLMVMLLALIAGNRFGETKGLTPGVLFTDSPTAAPAENEDADGTLGSEDSEEDSLSGANPVTEVDSAKELSENVGFQVDDAKAVPFQSDSKTYSAYDGGTAEITYSSGSQTMTYRKSEGTEDNSGDYNDYDNVQQQVIEGQEVTVKGNGDSYNTATWTSGDYSYSVQFEDGISEDEMKAFLGANVSGGTDEESTESTSEVNLQTQAVTQETEAAAETAQTDAWENGETGDAGSQENAGIEDSDVQKNAGDTSDDGNKGGAAGSVDTEEGADGPETAGNMDETAE